MKTKFYGKRGRSRSARDHRRHNKVKRQFKARCARTVGKWGY
ncbi:hypothetical protein ACWGRJ_34525 [Bradyrhizobium sp. Lot11]|jgi:hypothetical protein